MKLVFKSVIPQPFQDDAAYQVFMKKENKKNTCSMCGGSLMKNPPKGAKKCMCGSKKPVFKKSYEQDEDKSTRKFRAKVSKRAKKKVAAGEADNTKDAARDASQEIIDENEKYMKGENRRGIPKEDGTGQGIRANKGRGGCDSIVKNKYMKQKGNKKVAKVMREFENGTLRSSSGKKVTDRDQAIAIAMSEAEMSNKSFSKSKKIWVPPSGKRKGYYREDPRTKKGKSKKKSPLVNLPPDVKRHITGIMNKYDPGLTIKHDENMLSIHFNYPETTVTYLAGMSGQERDKAKSKAIILGSQLRWKLVNAVKKKGFEVEDHSFEKDTTSTVGVGKAGTVFIVSDYFIPKTEKSTRLVFDLQKAGAPRKTYQIGETSQQTGKKKVGKGKWVDPKTGKVSSGPGDDKEKKEGQSDQQGDQSRQEQVKQKVFGIVTKKLPDIAKKVMEAGGAAARGSEDEMAQQAGQAGEGLKNHALYSQADYDALSKKGYSDEEIKKVWDADQARGMTSPNKRKDKDAPDSVKTAAGESSRDKEGKKEKKSTKKKKDAKQSKEEDAKPDKNAPTKKMPADKGIDGKTYSSADLAKMEGKKGKDEKKPAKKKAKEENIWDKIKNDGSSKLDDDAYDNFVENGLGSASDDDEANDIYNEMNDHLKQVEKLKKKYKNKKIDLKGSGKNIQEKTRSLMEKYTSDQMYDYYDTQLSVAEDESEVKEINSSIKNHIKSTLGTKKGKKLKKSASLVFDLSKSKKIWVPPQGGKQGYFREDPRDAKKKEEKIVDGYVYRKTGPDKWVKLGKPGKVQSFAEKEESKKGSRKIKEEAAKTDTKAKIKEGQKVRVKQSSRNLGGAAGMVGKIKEIVGDAVRIINDAGEIFRVPQHELVYAKSIAYDWIYSPKLLLKSELKTGIKIEAEHKDLIKKIKSDIKKNGKLTLTDKQIYEIIAKVHIKEDKNYYTKLLKYIEKENGSGMEKSKKIWVPASGKRKGYYREDPRTKKGKAKKPEPSKTMLKELATSYAGRVDHEPSLLNKFADKKLLKKIKDAKKDPLSDGYWEKIDAVNSAKKAIRNEFKNRTPWANKIIEYWMKKKGGK